MKCKCGNELYPGEDVCLDCYISEVRKEALTPGVDLT